MGVAPVIEGTGNAAMDGVAWLLNVSTAVTIVFVNKVLMDPRKGYAFTFACTLSAIHFLTAAAGIMGAQVLGITQRARLPWKVTLYFAVVAVISIAALNLSLLVNPVGLYQIAKLLIIPFVCFVEAAWFGRRFSGPTLVAILTVIAGVAIVTVSDVGTGSTHLLGVLVAVVSVVASGMQQILCGAVQRQHKLASHQLLAAAAPVQGAMLLAVGPWVDAAVSGAWIGDYALNKPAAVVLVASCAISVGVNVSQFMCLGRFSAVTFQVLGHTKTILVLLISWLFLGEVMTGKKLLGMVLAVAGMIGYGWSMQAAAAANSLKGAKAAEPALRPAKGGEDAAAPLLQAVQGRAGSEPVVVVSVAAASREPSSS